MSYLTLFEVKFHPFRTCNYRSTKRKRLNSGTLCLVGVDSILQCDVIERMWNHWWWYMDLEVCDDRVLDTFSKNLQWTFYPPHWNTFEWILMKYSIIRWNIMLLHEHRSSGWHNFSYVSCYSKTFPVYFLCRHTCHLPSSKMCLVWTKRSSTICQSGSKINAKKGLTFFSNMHALGPNKAGFVFYGILKNWELGVTSSCSKSEFLVDVSVFGEKYAV